MKSWTERARRLRLELVALYLAARHPQTPWYAKLVVAGFVVYAVTPVDLFPDALPILGLVDDLIFVPIAIALAIRFVPSPVLAECRLRAHERVAAQPRVSWWLIGAVWALFTAAGIALYL
ncbi:MAG TPA: YkvA family protein [Burkholderiales bacterium]|nr:YkvA family protein [Burkholderiales bacterium]